MLKLLCFNFLVYLCGASVIQVPLNLKNEIEPLEKQSTRDLEQIQEKWTPHLIEFLNLVDTNKLLMMVMEHISDPDVVNFINFIGSQEFREVALKFEAIEEFKEAMDYLQNEGYDVNSILDLVNSLLDLQSSKTHDPVVPSKENGKGMTRFIAEILRALPIDDWKKLFEQKLETSSDVKELVETLTTEEFEDILKRLAANPQLSDIKKVFEFYGLDFDEINIMVNQIIGDRFRKIVFTNKI